MTQRDHTVTATILAIIGLYIIGLAALEIQPWDEGLYAVRGEGIALYGEWIDQTPHALGGLYSSTAPPVTSWGVAVGVSIFGRMAFGVRFFTLLCSAASLWLLFSIMRRFTGFQTALVSVIILGTSLHWMVYSRQAMTEVPLMMFTLLALWSTLQDFKKMWWVFALAFGGALLTKMAVSILPLLFLIPVLRADRSTRSIALVLASALGGLLLALPWYGVMISTYGSDFWQAMTVPHLMKAVEGNAGSLGYLYYVNQLLLAHPIVVVAFVFVALAVFRRQLLPPWLSSRAAVLFWFIGSMLVFSIAATKNPHYVVIILPAAVMTAVLGFEQILEKMPRRVTAVVMDIAFVALLWSGNPHMRETFRNPSQDLFFTIFYLFLAGMPLLMVIGPQRLIDVIVVRGLKPLTILLLVGATVGVVIVAIKGRAEDIKGGRKVASRLLEDAEFKTTFVYLYHQQNAGDAMNPQLAWYTAGWMNGWDSTYSYVPLHMPLDDQDVGVVAAAAYGMKPWVVYYHPGMRESVVREVMAGMAPTYDVELNLDHYTLFKRR